MLGENIKYYRIHNNLTQNELAEQLFVVRQTVSKWERGLSIPDIEMLQKLSKLLNVSMYELLDKKDSNFSTIEDINIIKNELQQLKQNNNLTKEASRKRGLIISLSFLSMHVSLIIKNPIVSIICSTLCLLIAILILIKNMTLLTIITTKNTKIGILKITTLFNLLILFTAVVFTILSGLDIIHINEKDERLCAMFLVSSVMIFTGIIATKLPFTKHTGLRLPWTIQNENTWNVAHRTLGVVSIPLSFIYIACSLTFDNFNLITLFFICMWIGIPGIISYIHYKNN